MGIYHQLKGDTLMTIRALCALGGAASVSFASEAVAIDLRSRAGILESFELIAPNSVQRFDSFFSIDAANYKSWAEGLNP